MLKFNSDIKFNISLIGNPSSKGADIFLLLIGLSIFVVSVGLIFKWCFLN